MLDVILEAVAADPGANPDLIRFVYANASRTSDERVLSILARNPSLPSDVEAALDAMPSAKVMVARLSRPGAPADKLLAAAKDKRVTVATAVASTVGLPDEVYDTVVKNHHAKVLTAVLSNGSATESSRKEAALALAAMPSGRWGGSLRSRIMLRDRLRAVLDEFPELANEFAAKGKDNKVLSFAVASPAISPEQLEDTLRRAFINYRDHFDPHRSYWESADETEVFKAAAAFTDCPADLLNEFVKLVNSRVNNYYAARRAATEIANARANQRVRAAYHPAPQDEGDGITDKAFKAMLGQALTLRERVKLAASFDLTDRQFARALLEGTTSWQFNIEIADSPQFRAAVADLAQASASNPVRLGAILARLPLSWMDSELFTQDILPDMISFMCSIADKSNWYTLRKHEWIKLVLDTGLSEQVANAVPAPVAFSSRLYFQRAEDYDPVSPAWRAAVGSYLFTRFGADDAPWRTVEKVAEEFPGSLSEVASTVLDTL